MKVRLAFRVGITGHRKLDSADLDRLDSTLARLFQDVETAVDGVAKSAAAELLYTKERPYLKVVSALAEGADRLAARAAVARSWGLVAPLPFPREEYEKDFPLTVAEFRSLIGHVSDGASDVGVVELDGSREREAASYLEAGRFVLANCDVLFAIWDGDREKGVGGSAQVVREAEDHGVPMLWIDSAAPHECRLFLADGPRRDMPYSRGAFTKVIEDALAPFDPAADEDVKKSNRLGLEDHTSSSALAFDEKVAPNFLGSGPFAAKAVPGARTIGRFFGWFVRLCAFGVPAIARDAFAATHMDPPAGRDNATVRMLYLEYQRADVLAVAYATLHRSTYMLIYLFGSFALACAVTSAYVGRGTLLFGYANAQHVFTAIELALLLGVVFLFICDRRGRWQDRWLDNRVIAELFRESDLLAQLGRGFPIDMLTAHERELPERAWTFRYHRAVARAAGIVSSRWTSAYLNACKAYLAEMRIAHQIHYHRWNVATSHVVNRRLKRVSEIFFVLTLVCVVVKLVAAEFAGAVMAGLWAGVFPAIAYGSFLIRNQAEFEIVVQRSERMRRRLEWRRESLARCVERADLSLSHQLGHEALQIGLIMLQDAANWAGIFTVKETEAG